MYSFLKEDTFGLRHQLTFIGDKLEFYIPQSYFDQNLASIVGDYIEVIGLLWFKADGKWYELTLPLKFMFGYSLQEKFSGKMRPNMQNMDYIIFTLEKGDAFCYDINHRKNVDDIMLFSAKLMEGGKMPRSIGYDEILVIMHNALQATDVGDLGVSSLTFEILLAELYRNKGKVTEPFRFYYNKHPNAIYDYKMIPVTKLPELTSTFTGLMGEDNKQQIVAAVMNGRLRKEGLIGEEKISPAEKLIKF